MTDLDVETRPCQTPPRPIYLRSRMNQGLPGAPGMPGPMGGGVVFRKSGQ